MQLRLSWSHVVFRPPILWLLVAIELMLFATAVHSVAARVHRSFGAKTFVGIPAAFLTPATEETNLNQTAPIAGATLEEASVAESDGPPPGGLEWERTYGDYPFRCYSGGSTGDDYVESRLEIWQRDTLVYTNSNYAFFAPEDEVAGTNDENETDAHLPPPGSDLTGRGQPDVVIQEYSGGAHCCSTYRIFELGDTFHEVAVIEAEHGEIEFVDLDGNGVPVIKMQDWSYAYVFGCFASSPAPDVILRYTNGHYKIAPDLMQTPAPAAEELQQMADEIKTNYAQMVEDGGLSDEWAADSGLWQQMLDLIYGGHEDEARRLYDMAWPAETDGKDETLTNFVESVSVSLYWKAVYGDEEEQGEKAPDNPNPGLQPPPQAKGE